MAKLCQLPSRPQNQVINLGWFIDSKTPFVFEDQENPTRVYCDINLFARWQINSYTVYYYDDPNQQPCFVREVLADEPIVNI